MFLESFVKQGLYMMQSVNYGQLFWKTILTFDTYMYSEAILVKILLTDLIGRIKAWNVTNSNFICHDSKNLE